MCFNTIASLWYLALVYKTFSKDLTKGNYVWSPSKLILAEYRVFSFMSHLVLQVKSPRRQSGGSMLSGCNSKLRAHDIFYHKQKAEKVHWKWPTSLSKFASSDTLPPAKTNFKSLPKQYSRGDQVFKCQVYWGKLIKYHTSDAENYQVVLGTN